MKLFEIHSSLVKAIQSLNIFKVNALMSVLKFGLVFLIIFAHNSDLQAQNKLRYNFDESGKTYIQASIRTQLWLRYTDMNPGSQINGEVVDNHVDISFRRFRFGLNAQITENLFFYSLWGWNNLNHITNKTEFVHALDLYTEYTFSPAITIGSGKSAWQGLSRWHIRSTISLMALDAPLYPLSTVNLIDDIGRNFGVWAKGQVGKFDYRLVAMLPTVFLSGNPGPDANYARVSPRWQTSAYLKYQFWDKESNKTAYHANTYLGTKKVLSIGSGFLFQPKAMWSQTDAMSPIRYHPMNHWSVDGFIDLPLNKSKNTALTSYLGYLYTDFGPNYVRNLSANNPANGLDANLRIYNGSGSAFPMMGTGSTIFHTLGFLLPKDFIVKNGQQLQPNIAIQYSNFEKLADPTLVIDLGVNWLIKGHGNKLTMGYQSRPLYQETVNGVEYFDRKGMLVLQYQIMIQ